MEPRDEGAEAVGSGEGVSPPRWGVWEFVILHFKWYIFMQFGVGIFTLKGHKVCKNTGIRQ